MKEKGTESGRDGLLSAFPYCTPVEVVVEGE